MGRPCWGGTEWREIEARHGLGAIGHLLEAGIEDGTIRPVAVAPSAHLLLSAADEAALFIAHAPIRQQPGSRWGRPWRPFWPVWRRQVLVDGCRSHRVHSHTACR